MELMPLNKKFFMLPVIALTIILLAAWLYFNFQKIGQPESYPVTIAVSKTPLSTPFYVAEKINAFDDTCVSVTYEDVIGGQRAFAKLMSGEADFSTTSDSVIAFQSLGQQKFVTHARFVQSDNDVKLITRAQDNIVSGKDLVNKTIGVTKGTASEYFLSNLLALDGLTIKNVTVKSYKPEQLMAAFMNKEVDAITPWEPYAFQTKKQLQEQVKVHDTKNLNTLGFHLVSQSADNLLVAKAACVLEGLTKAIDYISANPKKAQQIVKERLNLNQPFIDWIWPDYIFKVGLNRSFLLNIESQAVWAIDTQMTEYKKLPEFMTFIDTRALLQVAPMSVNIMASMEH